MAMSSYVQATLLLLLWAIQGALHAAFAVKLMATRGILKKILLIYFPLPDKTSKSDPYYNSNNQTSPFINPLAHLLLVLVLKLLYNFSSKGKTLNHQFDVLTHVHLNYKSS